MKEFKNFKDESDAISHFMVETYAFALAYNKAASHPDAYDLAHRTYRENVENFGRRDGVYEPPPKVGRVKLIVPKSNPWVDYGFDQIWDDPFRRDAEVATRSDWQTGEVLLIHSRELDKVIGLTGIFTLPEEQKNVYLRWTGVLPEYRQQHVFQKAIRELIDLIHDEEFSLPYGARHLIEIAPQTEYGTQVIIPAFERYGFRKDPNFPIPPNEDYGNMNQIAMVYNLDFGDDEDLEDEQETKL